MNKVQWKFTNWQIFAMLAALNLSLAWLVKERVISLEFMNILFREQVELTRLEDQVELWRGWFNLNFILVPVLLLIKFGFVSLIVQFPLLFRAEEIAYREILRAVMIAHLAMLAAAGIQVLILYLKPPQDMAMENLGRMPFSLAGLIGRYSILSNPARTVINRISIFELAWCLLIYYKLKPLAAMSKSDLSILVGGVWVFLLVLEWLGAEVLILLGS